MGPSAKIKDEHLILCVDRLLRRLCEHPEAVTLPSAAPADDEAIYIVQDKFTCQLDEPEFDESAARSAALALAAAKFDVLGSADYETMRLQYILERTQPHDGLDTGLLRQVASAVLIHPSGAVGLQLKNSKTMERSDST